MRKMKIKIAACFLFLFVSSLWCQQKDSVIAIHAGRLLDVRGGIYRQNVYIIVRGNRIESVAQSAPEGARVIDLTQATALPGLIDCHVHLLLNWKDLSPTQGLRVSSPQG